MEVRMDDHPVRRIVFRQGRRLTWVAEQLGISANYLHRILLPETHPARRPAPEDFYGRLSQLLGVPEDMLRPGRTELISGTEEPATAH
jgi:hypothetical protein